jgi:uncharacterized protein
MSTVSASPSLPRAVAARKLASQGQRLGGAVAQEVLPRLMDAVLESGPQVTVELQFSAEEGGKPEIHGHVETRVTLNCERCLKPVELTLAAEPALGLVRTDAEAEALPGRLDPCVLPGEDLDLFELVEEELLLALPIVAMHEDVSCQPWLAGVDDADDADDTQSPFRALERLKPRR